MQNVVTAMPKAAEELKAVSECGRTQAENLDGRIGYQARYRNVIAGRVRVEQALKLRGGPSSPLLPGGPRSHPAGMLMVD